MAESPEIVTPLVQPLIAPAPLPTTFTRNFQATNRNRRFDGKLLSLGNSQIDTSKKWIARIDWGDGTTSTVKVVYSSKTKRWEVAEDHIRGFAALPRSLNQMEE